MTKDKNKLAVFDMDGTLFDTGQVNYCAYAQAAEKLGYTIEEEQFLTAFNGKSYKEFLPLLGVADSSHMEQIHEAKKKLYPQYLDRAQPNEPLWQLIDIVKKEYVTAIATTASRRNTEDILSYFKVEGAFDFLITQEDVTRQKPNPECYIKAMKKAEVQPRNTIIFEDSPTGIQAAGASGAYVVNVMERHSLTDFMESLKSFEHSHE